MAGSVVLVPFAAPGDVARVRIERVGRRVCEGALEEVLEPSPDRVAAPCPVFGVCGGCQLQHLAGPAQLAAKRDAVRDALRRIGDLGDVDVEIEASPPYGWRARTELHVDPASARLGYRRARSHELVPVDDCPILVPALRAELARRASALDAPPSGIDRLALAAGDDGRVASGSRRVRQRILGVDYEFAADGFWQANRALVGTLVARAIAEDRGEVAVDLYAGAGLFALALARRFGVVHAVESRAPAVAALAENAASNAIGNVRARCADVERWLAGAEAPRRPDLVLLDPPRAGAGPRVVAALAALAPRRVTYVACEPTTLARDLRDLRERGYALESAVALDLFPQSYHVEVVARLARNPARSLPHAP